MIVVIAGAAAGAAAAQRKQEILAAQEQAVQLENETIGQSVAQASVSYVKARQPDLSEDPEKMLERRRIMDSPEFLLQDPMNITICRMMDDVIRGKVENNPKRIFRRGKEPAKHALIKEILHFFPGVEHDEVAARLRMMENAGLIEYQMSDLGAVTIYSPRVWTREGHGDCKDLGFCMSERLKLYLSSLDAQSKKAAER